MSFYITEVTKKSAWHDNNERLAGKRIPDTADIRPYDEETFTISMKMDNQIIKDCWFISPARITWRDY